MAQQNLGPEIASRMALFADAVRLRGHEPASFHVGTFQWQQLRDWANVEMGSPFEAVAQLHVDGLPVWRHPSNHHLEVEIICSDDRSLFEACLVK